MSGRDRWEERYRDSEFLGAPAPFLEEVLPYLPSGRALDVAAGLGANALLLARNGFAVEAIDWSFAASRKLAAAARIDSLPVRPLVADLRRFPLPRERYDVVLCFRFLDRSLWSPLIDALRPGGALVMSTFTLSELAYRPDFRREYCLEEGELLRELGASVRVARYEELPHARVASLLGYRRSTTAPRGAASGS